MCKPISVRGARGPPAAPKLVDRAEDGWALVRVQLLAHWNGHHGLSRPLSPPFLWSIPEPTPPSARGFLAMKVLRSRDAVAHEVLWEALQARSTGRVRASWVAAPPGALHWCLTCLLHAPGILRVVRRPISWRQSPRLFRCLPAVALSICRCSVLISNQSNQKEITIPQKKIPYHIPN